MNLLKNVCTKERTVVQNIGLVLEGGGMRGVYTAGVLEYFNEHEVIFPYIVGVSAGACHAASYISRQKGRNKKVTIDLVDHPNYLSYKNYFRNKELFGMDFIFNEIPNNIIPFDYETFHQSKQKFYIGTTDCHTGKSIFVEKNSCADKINLILKASSSLPLVAPMVTHNDLTLLDGGISNPIPIDKSERDGNKKNVVILTRNEGYQKKPQKFTWYLRKKYKEYPNLIHKMNTRHETYNSSIHYIETQEKAGNVFVFRPSKPLQVGRIERDKEKLNDLYELGYQDAKRLQHELDDWLKR